MAKVDHNFIDKIIKLLDINNQIISSNIQIIKQLSLKQIESRFQEEKKYNPNIVEIIKLFRDNSILEKRLYPDIITRINLLRDEAKKTFLINESIQNNRQNKIKQYLLINFIFLGFNLYFFYNFSNRCS